MSDETLENRNISSERGKAFPIRPFVPFIAFMLILSLFYVMLKGMNPPTPNLQAAPNEFSAYRAFDIVKNLVADGPRNSGSVGHQTAQTKIIDQLEYLGFEVRVQKTFNCRQITCMPITNIMTRIEGTESGPAVMLTAHYDTHPATLGVGDDTAGVASILEIARIIKLEKPFKNPVVLLFSDGEELGLIGADAFIKEDSWVKDIAAAINIEARGNQGQSLLFETSANNAWLASAYADADIKHSAFSLLYDIYQNMPNDTDLTLYKKEGMISLNFGLAEGRGHYHTELDNLENFSLGSLQHHGDNALAMLKVLANADLVNPPKGNAMYMDFFGGSMIVLSVAFAIPLSLLAFAIFIWASTRSIKAKDTSKKALVISLLVWPLLIAVATISGLILTKLVAIVAGAYNPWDAFPTPARIAIIVFTLLSVIFTLKIFVKHINVTSMMLSNGIWWSVIATVCAMFLPSSSIIFIFPALISALLFILIQKKSKCYTEIYTVISTLVATLFFLKVALLIEVAFGFNLPLAYSFFWGLIFIGLTPLFIDKSYTKANKIINVLTFIILLASIGIASMVPPHSELRPQKVVLVHFEDMNEKTSNWIISDTRNPLPKKYLTEAKFEEERAKIYPWSVSDRYQKADASGESAPEFKLLSSEKTAKGRKLTVEFSTLRQADVGWFFLPRYPDFEKVIINGSKVPLEYQASSPSKEWAVNVHNLKQAPVIIELYVSSLEPFEVMIMDDKHIVSDEGNIIFDAKPTAVAIDTSGNKHRILKRVIL
ncbi:MULTISPECIES: M28 family peptidase [unclassified Colwellia]|uniref:M28 family peptidase n=1 Tax=unclassified Colwellia TaxID=196834 RepID=UPI0015F3AA30|nr:MULTISPECIES: M28 family peptidase [unclassified Colwellia]MBA6257662.1 M28 family peptidase [Colwellia sp. MB3u-28]MBA6259419.1 M28 family peptidase [Colwellia sp. MB3u-41]MBA6304378.1 M28 family peptidase [Colwellia sp. MB02u-14]